MRVTERPAGGVIVPDGRATERTCGEGRVKALERFAVVRVEGYR